MGHAVFHAAAAVVSADDHMFDLEILDGVLHDAERVHVRFGYQIADVAMNEEFARLAAGEVFGRNAGVGAADPEKFRLLTLSEFLKEIVAQGELALDPVLVRLKKLSIRIHYASGCKPVLPGLC